MTLEIRNPRRFLSALSQMGIDRYVSARVDGPTLKDLEHQVKSCTHCPLSLTRKSVVFGEGDEHAPLVFVGEAPGEEEDLQGRPFVGRAGRLLDQLIQKVGVDREDVYICNVLKCRPPHNRDPEGLEVEACQKYLFSQLELIQPRAICTLGRHAYNTLLNVDERITRIRGIFTQYNGITLLPTYHPSYLLRNQGAMQDAYDDMEKLRVYLQIE
jgi:uracil-DNA glycosylase